MTTTTKKRKRSHYKLVVLLDRDDLAALETAAESEKLTKADVVRRSIRAHARRVRQQSIAAA